MTGPASPLHAAWPWLLGLGALSLLGGIAAFAHPFAASLTVVSLAGLTFILSGILKGIYAMRIKGDAAFVIALLLAALMIFIGVSLWVNPLAGLISLTALVATLFVAIGIVKIAFALRLAAPMGRGWIVASGLVSLLLGVMIFANFPQSATTILGLILGVELAFNGLAFILTALALRNL